MYPRPGDYVHVEGSYGGKRIDVTGWVEPSRKNPSTAAFRTRSGAVLGVIRDAFGRRHTVPWSTNYVTFRILGR